MPFERDRSNNFDAIRLLAAITVIVGHAWPLTGTPNSPEIAGIKIFHLAVFVFFSLSGYLVGTSWVRDARVWPFLLRRISRIFPALVVVVLVSVFVLGPTVSILPVQEYFSSPVTWLYLQNLTLFATYELPGVFLDHPRPVVNGSLWTIGPEFLCYLSVILMGFITIAIPERGRAVGAGVLFFSLGVLLAGLSLSPGFVPPDVQPTLEAMTFFAFGAALAQIGIKTLPLWPGAVLAFAWVIGSSLTDVADIVWCWIALPYLVVAIGAKSTPYARRAGRFGDMSYGLYLWGFPIQQLVYLLAPGLPLLVNILLVLVIVTVIAAVSWHLVEAPALRAGRRRASQRPQAADF